MKEQPTDGDYTMYKKRKVFDKVEKTTSYAVKYGRDSYFLFDNLEDAIARKDALLANGFKKVTLFYQEEVTTMTTWRLT